MVDEQTQQFREIEYNIIAAGGGFTSMELNHFLQQLNSKEALFPGQILPNNYNLNMKAFFKALQPHMPHPDGSVALIYNHEETVLFLPIREIFKEEGVKFIDIRLEDFREENFKLKEGSLFFKDQPLNVMYFRHFYDHTHFDEDAIKLHSMAHASNVIMIPNPLTLLMSLKNTQHLFYSKPMLEKYHLSELREACPSYFSHLSPTFHLRLDFENSK